ncbi:BMP family protein [Clostridium thailandense]|uniref:BMP family ABC transporter substrate-binding protein n=1 Tax=Clostridium thailandense TaxID=2794346 RepID=A0A949TMH1_9CLOT|nr:BMP family ABC transporter substrate-binding protein [Clostridium thailandense]MBV7273167.1 BMP family ABC transporter substrate-binding protein [Clostridium thailandense]MCH5136024.1 BMP family ABC transporter substrate-binding protein [Clostridiaceae bacterium UIB06]
MNKKRFIAMFSAAVVSVSLFSGCGSKQESKPITEGTPKSSQIKVGLSTDEGGLNDKSFNQAADTGIKEAQKKFGIDYKPIESTKKEDYEANLEALVSNGSNLTFGVGFQMEQAMKNVAEKHKDKNFAIIDTVVDSPNVESITFKEQEGSFLMGIIAGKMTKTNKVGFIGGKDQALINKFEAGFAAGVKAVNPEAATGLISADGKAPGTMVKYADSFNDTNKGYELAKSLYGSGCDVIYHAAGGVGIGMFKAAKELKDSGKTVWGIGVDMDQAVTVPEYAGIILSSMVKRVDIATYNAVQDVVNGKFQGGKHVELGLKDNGVGIAGTSNKNTPQDVLDLVNKFSEAIKAGKFTVPATRDEVSKFTAPSI